MSDDIERDRLAQELRNSLARHAAEAPRGDMLAERIVTAAQQRHADPRRLPRRTWRTWTLPLVAAGTVAGVVVAVAAIENYHPSSAPPPAGSHSVSVPPSIVPTHSTAAPTPSTAAPTDTTTLHNVTILDVTFVGDHGVYTGWALASADCIGKPGRCTAMLYTKDGTTWTSMANTPFNVRGITGGCGYPCVSNIRFATKDVGYVFGPKALLMTTDGGAHWARQSGGALYLESLDSNVIRVIADSPSGCSGPCGVRVETSDIGSTTWTPANLGPLSSDAVEFSRGGSNAYLLVMRNPAGGAGVATSTLYRSANDGRSWTPSGEPCPPSGGEVDSYAVAAGGGDLVSVLCATRQAPQRWFVATSTDGGAHFTAQPGTVPAATANLLTGDPTTVLVTAGDGLALSTNGGRTWHRVAGVTGSIGFVGFESSKVGRAVSLDGTMIWTTRDGGQTWRSVTMP